MAKTKKAEVVEPKEDEIEETVTNEDTQAAETLATHPIVSRSEVLAMAAKTISEMPRDDLSKWWYDTLALSKDLGKNIPDGAAERNKNSLNMKPSNASAANLTAPLASIQAVKEDLSVLLAGQENLPEEFVEKALVLFESAVSARVVAEAAKIQEEQEKALAEEIESLTDKVDEYLDYVAKEFFEENKIAVESALKVKMHEEFINDLHELYVKHRIASPEDQDVLESYAQHVEELTDEINARTEELIQLKDALDAERADRVFKEATKGLSATDVEQFKKLAETVEFTGDEADLAKKLSIIRESHFDKKKAPSRALAESLKDDGKVVTVTLTEEESTKTEVITDPDVAAIVASISRAEARKRL